MSIFRFQPPEEGGDLGPPPGPFRFRQRRRWRLPGGLMRWAALLAVIIILFVVASVGRDIYADWLWFQSVGFRSVYRLRLVTRVWLFSAGAGVFLLFFGANVLAAVRVAARDFPDVAFRIGDAEPAAVRRIGIVVALAAAFFVAVIFGAQAAGQWNTMLLFIHSQSFGVADPAFHKDIGFYVFRLPALHFIVGWSLAMVILTTVVVVGVYAARLALGGLSKAPAPARPHVSLLLVIVLGLFVWRYWLGRYDLVYSNRGAAFGAGYTDMHAQLPVTYVLMALASLTALCILVSVYRRGLLVLPVASTALWVVAGIAGGMIYPASVQRFQVVPNELAKELPYIQRNIQATRAAFGLDAIDERPFPAAVSVTNQEIAANPQTVQNIRLWDPRPLLQTLNQLQSIRPLYTFQNVDVDRYQIGGQLRQVMLAARELDPARLPADAHSWVNQRLQFTHGFGLAMLPVNEVVQEGLPDFFVKDIPPAGALPIDQPRIYYGEQPDEYVVVDTKYKEFDYPIASDQQAQNNYQGAGGVKLSGFIRRLVYAWKFSDTNILISDAFTGDSRILYRRNIADRVHAIAPFLRLDADPYLVAADGKLYWIQDAYTYTDRYPYSAPIDGLNYIRNSVKVVVNAYDGSLTFYLVEPNDPIARAYAAIYPHLFTPLDQMPASLRAHIRYPEDLFRVQAQAYLRYHIRDATVFFNKEDVWDVPTEVFTGSEQSVQPYYLIMRLPGEQQEEFVLVMPFRPANRNNTIAWLAARADGTNYGKLLTFRFPTDALVYGPSQVESRIDQDTTISAQISLWNQSGSQVIRGNLLMIPIGAGNLFVEPLYLQATASNLPELKRVVVVNGNSIAMEPTLGRALDVVLGRAPPSTIEGGGGPTPAASPTPGANETPAPTPTPAPTSALPNDVNSLIAQANAAYNAAQQALRQGDFAGYGTQIAQLQQILQRLMQLSGQ
jgi:uncharacterized membrane protein (UPF0182 family)